MMLVICDKDPYLAGKFLIENTNKNFVYKQLLELCQLICSAGISEEYKKIPQGKELQKWIKNNAGWVWKYMDCLYCFCLKNVRLKNMTIEHIDTIYHDIYHYNLNPTDDINNAVFRYKEGYQSKHKTNTLLPIDIAVDEYKKYITKYKFPQNNILTNK